MTTVLTAVISGLCVAVPSIVATISANKRNNDLVLYRINELDQKVHEHNQLINRMYKVESDIKIINEKVTDLEKKWKQSNYFRGK